MKILIGNKDHVDFDYPVIMTDEQRGKFIKFMSGLFHVVEEGVFEETRTDRLGCDKSFFLSWSPKELVYLFKIEDTETAVRKLGRTRMSVGIKRGEMLPQFLFWVHQKGIDLVDITEELVKQYIAENEFKKLETQKKRQEGGLIKRRIESMNECKVGTEEFGDECKEGFHKGCFVCPFSKNYIKTDEDVEKFNKVWRENFVEKEEISS